LPCVSDGFLTRRVAKKKREIEKFGGQSLGRTASCKQCCLQRAVVGIVSTACVMPHDTSAVFVWWARVGVVDYWSYGVGSQWLFGTNNRAGAAAAAAADALVLQDWFFLVAELLCTCTKSVCCTYTVHVKDSCHISRVCTCTAGLPPSLVCRPPYCCLCVKTAVVYSGMCTKQSSQWSVVAFHPY
jgi:hypothetical protein